MSTKPTGWPDGVDLVILGSIGSTMTEAARRAPSLIRPTWIMAQMQTDARGRRGRAWDAPSGNLYATLVYRPGCVASEAANRSFVAANALYATLADYVPAYQLGLKWPNDVLLAGRKVAGILLEASGHREELDYLSIGIGVNLASAPKDLPDAAFPPVSLQEISGTTITPEAFLTTLAQNMVTQEQLLTTHGFARIRTDWLRHATRLGEVIKARTMTDTITGVFDTVDERGNLVLITGAGPHVIPAADVYF